MANDRSILERQMERVEPRPFTLDGFHRRRERKQRNRRIGTAVVALAVAAAGIGGLARAYLSGPGPTPADQRSPFVGTWVSTDGDGSSQTMVVRASSEGAYEIVVRDDAASVCSGAPSTMTGTGRLDDARRLVIPSPVLTCDDGSEPEALSGPPLEEQLRNMTFVHDPESDSLTDNFEVVWERVLGDDKRPEPARLGSLAYALDGDIYVAESDGSNAVRIADGRPPTECGGFGLGEYWVEGPIWSPDGRYLAYRHANCDEPQHAWRDVVISDPEGNVVAEFRPWSSVNRLRGTSGAGWDISWSPDSTRVAVWADLFETIGVFGVDGVRQAMLTVPPGMLSAGDRDPMWLPDGESLLVDDVVVPIDGSAPSKLPLADRGRAYSPDGSRVAYTTRKSLVVAEADGSNPQEVFADWAGEPVWSPTGDRIAFTSGRPEPDAVNELRVADVANGRVTLLAKNEEIDQVIDFSPDGDRILFSRTRREDDVNSLWSINADGSDLRRLVAATTWGDWWSPSPTP